MTMEVREIIEYVFMTYFFGSYLVVFLWLAYELYKEGGTKSSAILWIISPIVPLLLLVSYLDDIDFNK